MSCWSNNDDKRNSIEPPVPEFSGISNSHEDQQRHYKLLKATMEARLQNIPDSNESREEIVEQLRVPRYLIFLQIPS